MSEWMPTEGGNAEVVATNNAVRLAVFNSMQFCDLSQARVKVSQDAGKDTVHLTLKAGDYHRVTFSGTVDELRGLLDEMHGALPGKVVYPYGIGEG